MRSFSLVGAAIAVSLLAGSTAAIGQSTDQMQIDDSNGTQAGTRAGTTSRDPSYEPTPSVPASTTDSSGQYRPDQINSALTPNDTLNDGTARPTAVTPDQVASARLLRLRPLPRPNEFEQYVSTLVDRPVRRLGAELLVPAAGNFTAPPTTAIPSDYRINPGDELVLGVVGALQGNDMRLVVDQEGRVFVPRVGAVRVGGVAYRDLQATIAAEVSRQYRDFQLSVTIGRLHGITVYLTGFAATPGSYTVSSLSTVVNAVLAAGGAASGGSFRSIQVRRGGRLVADFDLYDFLLKGDKHADIVLQNEDVVFIAPAGSQVAVLGSVNKEAIYESSAHDTLTDVLLYAGGANTVADLARLYVLDPKADNGWQEVSPEQAMAAPVVRGQILRVISGIGIAQPVQRLQSLVTVSGEVQKPGRYFVAPGSTLDQVIAQAGGLTRQAYPFGAVFTRESLRTQQQIHFDHAVDDINLALSAEPLVSAYARQSDSSSRLLALRSLISQLRTQKIEGRLVLEISPATPAIPGGFAVENNDMLVVPTQPLNVGVFGMVNSSANYRYVPGRRIADYLEMAGGTTRIADKSHTFVVRANGTVVARRALRTAALPGDTIFVPVDAERGLLWAKIRDLATIGLNGAVTAATVAAVSN